MIARVVCGLMLVLCPWAAEAAPMLVASSSHFRIFSNQSDAQLRSFAGQLERYDALLHHITGIQDDTSVPPLTIYVVTDPSDVGMGSNILGYYASFAAGPFAVVPRKVYGISTAGVPQIVLFHEYAHHFMLQNFPALYSPWFVEGFAEFYSTTQITDTGANIGQPEPLRINDLMLNWTTSLPYLLAPGDKALTVAQTSELYARAWLLVHYLTLSSRRGGQISAYLKARSGGMGEEAAFQAAFHVSIQDMDKELRTYFAPHQLPYAAVDAPASGVVSVRPASAGEVALTKLVPRLRWLQNDEDWLATSKPGIADKISVEHHADQLAADARVAGRKQPDDMALQTIVAECELAAGQMDAARETASAILKVQPGDARAHLALGMAIIAGAKPGDMSAVLDGRKEIVAANRAAPDDPMPLIAYYRSFADHGLQPTALAVQGLERAQQLAPQDEQVRLMLAREEIALKRYRAAATLLRPVAFAPHPGPRRDEAQKLLASLPDEHEQAPPAVAGS
jgi:hypothetical protein